MIYCWVDEEMDKMGSDQTIYRGHNITCFSNRNIASISTGSTRRREAFLSAKEELVSAFLEMRKPKSGIQTGRNSPSVDNAFGQCR
jgi:hypothetical protein